jgi:hypothetical protein
LAGAGDLVRSGQRQMTGLSGMLPPNYTSFASDAVQALDAASGTPAGQRALIATLGARVAHVNAYKVQHARRPRCCGR